MPRLIQILALLLLFPLALAEQPRDVATSLFASLAGTEVNCTEWGMGVLVADHDVGYCAFVHDLLTELNQELANATLARFDATPTSNWGIHSVPGGDAYMRAYRAPTFGYVVGLLVTPSAGGTLVVIVAKNR